MASTLADFALQINKQHPSVSLATDSSTSLDYDLLKNNPYRRAITIDNTGKAAKTGYLLSFQIDHWSLYMNGKSAFSFSDLRVYDSDNATILEHQIQSPASDKCTIFVSVPSIGAGATKTIYIYYGNPALANTSVNTLLGWTTPARNNIRDWHISTEAVRSFYSGSNGGFYNQGPFGAAPVWENVQNRGRPVGRLVTDDNSFGTPVVSYGSLINNYPTMAYNGANSLHRMYLSGNPFTNFNQGTIYVVLRTPASIPAGETVVVSGPTNSPQMSISASPAKLRFAQSGVVGVNGATTLTGNTNYICCVKWVKSGGTTAYEIRLNGVVDANGNIATVNDFGGYSSLGHAGGSFFLNANIAEIMIFSLNLDTAGFTSVENYLNTKYRVYSTTDMPIITIGAETASPQTQSFTYQAYSPIADYNYTSKLNEKVIGYEESEGTVNLQNVLHKTIAVGNRLETWTNSTLDSAGVLSCKECQKVAASTTAVTAESVIDRTVIGNNLHDLSKFEIANLVDGASSIASDDNDYIQFEISLATPATLDLANSFIRFENSANTLAYQSSFSNNVNGLITGKNIIKIKKSSFTKTGAGTWQDASYKVKVALQTTSGTQDIYFGYIELVGNYETRIISKNTINLGNAVSSDNDATYYTHTLLPGTITGRYISTDSTKAEVQGILDNFLDKKFSDLPGFPAGFWTSHFINETLFLSGFVSSASQNTYYTYTLKKVLGFAFPDSLLDINLDIDDGSPTGCDSSVFVIYPSDKVKEVIFERILKPVNGILVYSPLTNKITARNGQKYLDKASTIFTPIIEIADDKILKYKENTEKNDEIYNYLSIENNYVDNRLLGSAIYTNEMQAELPSGQRTAVEMPVSDKLFEEGKYYLLTAPVIDGWNVADSAVSDAYNNTGVKIMDTYLFDNKIFVHFFNSSGSAKFLRSIHVRCTNIFWRENLSATIYQNSDSVRAYGKKEYEPVDSIYWQKRSHLNNFLNIFGNAKNKVEVDVVFDPKYSIGQTVKIKNTENRVITGYIAELKNYIQGGEYISSIKIIEV